MQETEVSGRNNPIYSLQKKNDIIAMLLEGKEAREIKEYVVKKYKLTHGSAGVAIQKARDEIKKREHFEIQNVINLHLSRYEKIYEKLREMKAQIYAMEALKAKEKLLQFHREGFHMKVTKGEIQAIHLEHVSDEYDIEGKLSKEEKERLKELLKKAETINGPDRDEEGN